MTVASSPAAGRSVTQPPRTAAFKLTWAAASLLPEIECIQAAGRAVEAARETGPSIGAGIGAMLACVGLGQGVARPRLNRRNHAGGRRFPSGLLLLSLRRRRQGGPTYGPPCNLPLAVMPSPAYLSADVVEAGLHTCALVRRQSFSLPVHATDPLPDAA